MGVWSGSYAFHWLPVPSQLKTHLPSITYLGVVTVPSLFLIFGLTFSNFEKLVTRRLIFGLCLEPVITLLLLWTNEYHHLIFLSVVSQERNGQMWLQITHGLWYQINLVYSYLVITLGIAALLIGLLRSSPLMKKQYYIILVAALIPWAGSFYGEYYKAAFPLDVTPLTFGLSGIIFAYSIVRNRFIDIIPVARSRLIESMSDSVLVLDLQNRIVDINPAMKDLLELDPSSSLGKHASEALNTWMDQTDSVLHGENTRFELRLPGSPVRYLDLRVTPLYDYRGRLNGKLLVFRDVTDRKQVEKKLRYANDRLQSQLIEIGMLQSELRSQAIRDPLTNLFNRRYLDETLERELARAAREHYPVCVIMMDLDHFKKVNDTYGHEGGDQVLQALAETLVARNRRGDFTCRYGGEEFVVVMPNIAVDVAYQRAEVLRETLNSLQIPYGNFLLSTTVSIGIAAYPANAEERESLLRAADRAMYAAKKAGRNHILTYDKLEAQDPVANN